MKQGFTAKKDSLKLGFKKQRHYLWFSDGSPSTVQSNLLSENEKKMFKIPLIAPKQTKFWRTMGKLPFLCASSLILKGCKQTLKCQWWSKFCQNLSPSAKTTMVQKYCLMSTLSHELAYPYFHYFWQGYRDFFLRNSFIYSLYVWEQKTSDARSEIIVMVWYSGVNFNLFHAHFLALPIFNLNLQNFAWEEKIGCHWGDIYLRSLDWTNPALS